MDNQNIILKIKKRILESKEEVENRMKSLDEKDNIKFYNFCNGHTSAYNEILSNINMLLEQMENLKVIIESIEGLKLQSEVALASKGNNSLIDKEKLAEAHNKIFAPSLQDEVLKRYMSEKVVSSYIDIDLKDFKSYYIEKMQ